MIPNKLHFIWLGGSLPDKYNRYIETWRFHHPGWEIKIWNDNDAENFPMKRREVFDGVTNWGAKSDIFRYEILFAEGGVYADTDFLCVRSFEPLLSHSFFCGVFAPQNDGLINALIGSEPSHPLIEKLLNGLKRPATDFSAEAVFSSTGPDYFSRIVYEYRAQKPKGIAILPHDSFYPMPNTFSKVSEPPWREYITPQTYAVHLWDYSWQKDTLWEKIRKTLLKPIPKTWKDTVKNFLKRKT